MNRELLLLVDALRISVGFFTTEDELERFAEAVTLLASHTPETLQPRRILAILGQTATGGTKKWGPQVIPADVVQGRFNVILGPTDTASRASRSNSLARNAISSPPTEHRRAPRSMRRWPTVFVVEGPPST